MILKLEKLVHVFFNAKKYPNDELEFLDELVPLEDEDEKNVRR